MAKSLPMLFQTSDHETPLRIADSVLAQDGVVMSTAEFRTWFAHRAMVNAARVRKIGLDDLVRWSSCPDTGNIVHDSGKFFSVEGLEVELPGGPVPSWTQPIINQPEIGILGILVKEFDGVLHCLMQAKNEPGNCNGVQLSPTVQATRSNYTRVHQGDPVPYLEYFQDTVPHRVIADVLQSEQGSWFYRKRNRNMVVEVDGDVELLDGFCWLTIGQLHRLMASDDLINMDSRTVLSCLPFSGVDVASAFSAGDPGPRSGDPAFRSSVARSCSENQGSVHTTGEILSWITDARARMDVRTTRIPLRQVKNWSRSRFSLSHDTGRFFDVIAVDIEVGHREVSHWTQPMIEPYGTGIVAFLVTRMDGVLHVLVRASVEPGYLDVVELAPTVQCTPSNYAALPPAARPRFLDYVLNATPGQIRFDTLLSEEGGRFYHAQNRYCIVETAPGDVDLVASPDFRWMSLHQLVGLLRHSHYINVQARSLIACLHSLTIEPGMH